MDVGSPGAEEVPLPLTQASIGGLHSEGALPLRIGGYRFAANCIPGTALAKSPAGRSQDWLVTRILPSGWATATSVSLFLLVFDDGDFDEDTFLLTDWIKHIPPEVLAKNFGVPASAFDKSLDPSHAYIFPAPVPGPLAGDKIAGATEVPQSFSHRMLAQTPIKSKGGSVRITDSKNFPVSKTIAAALVEVEPGGMRELHWHPNTDEWQYYISGSARMGVFAASGQARTFDFEENDVGYVPFAMGHYIENTGKTTLRFLEMFKSDYYADVSLNQWLALTPPELVSAHLHADSQLMQALRKEKMPVV